MKIKKCIKKNVRIENKTYKNSLINNHYKSIKISDAF